MKIQLQTFIHKYTSYARPNQTWSCGKLDQGYSCEAGPDAQGCCRTEYECKPYKGETGWVCTRSNNYGGNCTDGPKLNGECCNKIIKCLPVRSIKEKRRLWVKWVTFCFFAVLLLFLNGHFKADVFSPGKLSFQHAKIEKCSTCHAIFDQHFFGWVQQAVSGKNVIHNSQKCLDCHKFGDNAHHAHGLASEELKQIKQAKEQVDDKEKKQLACLNCHLEHKGQESGLSDVAKQNCAFCHQLDPSIINAKHPEFVHYPYRRKTRIIFDHGTHANKYYYNKVGDQLLDTAPDSCLSCHQSDDNGIKMLQHSYDDDCKSCHNEIFEEAESFIVFEIPEIAFDGTELKVDWPEEASGMLTPFMIMLLATDSLFTEAVAELEDYDDLTGLNKQKTLKLIKSIKKLFYEVDHLGPIVFKQRMEKTLNCQLNGQGQFVSGSFCEIHKAELEQWVNIFPVNLFCEAKKRWFPHLLNEFEKILETDSKHYCDKNNGSIVTTEVVGKWSLDSLIIEYRPEKHKDMFLKSWLDLTSQKLNQKVLEKTRLELFNELNSKNASVQCTKCHSIESADGKNFKVNWLANAGYSGKKEFIKFRHDAHIKYQDEKVCINCHTENEDAEYIESYENFDSSIFESNFITKSKDCSTCHLESMLNKQCQICHNYHIGVDPQP